MPVLLQQAIASGNTDLAKDIIGLMRELKHEKAKEEFFTTFVAISAKFPAIIKTKEVNFVGKTGKRTNYTHAELGVIIDTVRPILAEGGLSLTWDVANDLAAGTVTVTARLTNRLGYEHRGSPLTLPIVADTMNVSQAVGSAQTYGQRYTGVAILGLGAKEDDDGRGTDIAPRITAGQCQELIDLYDKWAPSQALAEAFGRTYKITDLNELPASKFEECKTYLAGKVAGKVQQ